MFVLIMLACGGCRVSLSCLAGRCKHLSFAASSTLRWYTCLERRMSWLTYCHDVLTWLLQLSGWMTCRVQPDCCSVYEMLSSGPLETSGMLPWKKHTLGMADLLCVMVWYVALCMVKKWH